MFFPKFEFQEAQFLQTPLTPLTPAKKKVSIQILSLAPKFEFQESQFTQTPLTPVKKKCHFKLFFPKFEFQEAQFLQTPQLGKVEEAKCNLVNFNSN